MTANAALIDILRSNEPALRRFGVAHLSIFGSRARGDQRHDSDLDVLVDLIANTSHIDRVAKGRAELAVSGMLSNITGHDISLVFRDRLPDSLAQRIADDLIPVF